jgi:hypothetical protein
MVKAAVTGFGREQPEHARLLANLGITLLTSYIRTGEPEVLTEAVTATRDALAAIPDSSPGRARCLSNLGAALLALYLRTQELQTLTESVGASRAAVAAAGTQHQYATYLGNLAQALLIHYRRTGNLAALAEAEQAGRAAVAATQEGHPFYARNLANLGIVRAAQFGEDGRPDTLTEAAAITRNAVRACLDGDPDRARYLSNLCTVLDALFDQGKDPSVLAEAVTAGRMAMAAAAPGQVVYPRCALSLGLALHSLYGEAGQPEILSEARAVLAEAAESAAFPVTDQIVARLEQARAETLAGDDESANATVGQIMRLMPFVAPGELRRADREYRLGEIAGIGEVAAATALSAGDTVRAIERLEQARGQLLGEAMDARLNLDRLRTSAPGLADDFERLRGQLSASAAELPLLIAPETDMVPIGTGGRLAAPQTTRRRLGGMADDALLDRIRARPGLADFLTVPSIAQLSRHASGGPIVMVTAAWNRGDALIVNPDPDHPLRHVPLPGLTRDIVQQQVQRLLDARRAAAGGPGVRARRSAQGDFHEILAWLWDTAAEPVLAALGYTGMPAGGHAWPRVWWCPVGALSFLPVHAAGYHLAQPDNPRTVLDRVVSSYTATIRALAYSRQAPPASRGTADTCLIVAMPDTPGAASLPGTSREVSQLAALLPGARVLRGDDATRDSVLAALPGTRVAHFACHGISDWDDPGRSRLLLHDHEADPLTIGAISRLELAGADLAYLSACYTTETSPRLSDEAVHITSAFQLAGYRNVIGTLWPVNDAAATEVAIGVYQYLTGGGVRPVDSGSAAVALHNATRSLRAKCPQLLTQWAAHVHTGV